MDDSDPDGFRRFLSVVDGEVDVVDEVLPPLRERLLENASGICTGAVRMRLRIESAKDESFCETEKQATTHRFVDNPRAF